MLPDKEDKRKQRIIVTEKTKEFCESHDEQSQQVVGKMFEGIAPQDIAITIKTISQMAKNIEEV